MGGLGWPLICLPLLASSRSPLAIARAYDDRARRHGDGGLA